MRVFRHHATVLPEWIDYNGHMQDAYYGLVFSFAADSFQDEVGFDAAYRKATGCTIYLLEDHKHFLREVKEGEAVLVETRVLACDAKRFHLHMQMLRGEDVAAVAEMMELHVRQDPQPQAAPIPHEILARLEAAVLSEGEIHGLRWRAREIGLEAGRER